ncbi:MAG: histidine phosphatase family protein [Negativibacillus massiliensis]|uniref:histidine phosphatase family protein n=1 Tax=Negativibacillus massiliensis TaxID=1871035 RepID=UPI0023F63CE4|nr:histidine phosphatase family protein [Negativibacillus massiliensis]
MTILYLIRHGETGGNYEGRFQGIIDNPLNEYGIRQAKMLGEAFSLSKIDVLYTSPLQRAKKTAEIIAEMHGLEKLSPIVDEGLIELNGGLLEGRKFSELAKEYPEVMEAMHSCPASMECPGGESMRDVSERIVKTIDRLVEQNKGKVIVAVSHGIIISSYIHFASGKPFEEMSNSMVANASVSKFLFNDDMIICMEYADDRRHMKHGTYLETTGFEKHECPNPDPYAVENQN